jgi:protocatechuate 4,5-dioxygenase beta chain
MGGNGKISRMLGLGLAFSHAPAMFCPPELWPAAYATIPEAMRESQPRAAKLETMEVIRGYVERIQRAYGILGDQIKSYRPDALVFIGDDQEDMFDARDAPALCIFTGDRVWGTSAPRYLKVEPGAARVEIPVHAALAQHLRTGLLQRGFEVAGLGAMPSAGPHPERGVSHMLALPYPRLVPALDIPVIPFFINAYYPPQPTAARCWELGVAIAEVLRDRPERVAICASGGMSHDPQGPRAGWIDEPLDRWVLERIESNRGAELKNLFTFDSDTLRGGTGELRAWVSAAGACQWPATVVDYVPAHHVKAGLGFAYWPPREA